MEGRASPGTRRVYRGAGLEGGVAEGPEAFLWLVENGRMVVMVIMVLRIVPIPPFPTNQR